jgi:hypothetical protein
MVLEVSACSGPTFSKAASMSVLASGSRFVKVAPTSVLVLRLRFIRSNQRSGPKFSEVASRLVDFQGPESARWIKDQHSFKVQIQSG